MKKNRGKYCEEIARIYFQKRGWILWAQNKRIAGVEIDFIFNSPQAFLLVEVKSDNQWRREHPVSKKQKQRLRQAFMAFCEVRQEKPSFFEIVFVDKKNQLHIFDLEFENF